MDDIKVQKLKAIETIIPVSKSSMLARGNNRGTKNSRLQYKG
jgi:hypothetical protein